MIIINEVDANLWSNMSFDVIFQVLLANKKENGYKLA